MCVVIGRMVVSVVEREVVCIFYCFEILICHIEGMLICYTLNYFTSVPINACFIKHTCYFDEVNVINLVF